MAYRAAIICGILVATGFAAFAQRQYFNTVPVAISAEATIDILNVGQGDAIHIRSSTDTDVLIDGGLDATVVERLGEVLPFWDRTIEVMMLSHPDSDHITGLLTVFDYYTVKQLILVDVPATGALQTELLKRATAQGTIINYLRADAELTLSPVESITVLYPFINTNVADLSTNDASLILLYSFNRTDGQKPTTFLTSGDASEVVEAELVALNLVPDVDILKAGHHGSASSSSSGYLAAAQAEFAVVSVGEDNDYGHPAASALERLAITSQILRTDQQGTITFKVDAAGYSLE
ncbi:MAG: hypothetical protein ACD_43C00062G0002 [uncultured bacterium]|nr:MAG: hypothetical protein ACD_43C00062G0002 [uncultured bacterium]